jgi:hypothetical protein
MIFFKYLAHTYQGADHTGRRVLNMGGGGGGPSTSTTYTSNIPDWLRPQTEALLGAATQEYFNTEFNPETGQYDIVGTKPYQPFSEDKSAYFAPFSRQQQDVFSEAARMQTPGGFQTGQRMTGTAGMGALGTTQQALGYGAQGAGFGGQGAFLGQQAAGMGGMYERMATDPMSMQGYMSPYMQQVVERQKAAAIEDAQRANLGANLAASRQGTYGGARQAIAQGLRESALEKQLGDIQAQGLQSAFDQARQAQQFGVTTGLQGLQTGIQGAQTGISGAGMGLQGVQGAQAGYGMLGQMGRQAADIGAAEQAANLARLGYQQELGGLQQAQQQQIINQAIQDYALSQEMPMQRLAGYSGLLRGYATPTTTVSQYQAAPTGLQQLSGLGMTAAGIGTIAGMGKKEGGEVKSYAAGGIAETEDLAEMLSIPQLQQSIKNKSLPEYIGIPMLEQKVNMAERMKMSGIAPDMGGEPPIAQQVMARANQLEGIDAAPVRVAGGGMIAFSDGGVPRFQNQGIVLGEPEVTQEMLEAERKRQEMFLGTDPRTQKMRELLEKQGQESFFDRLMRGSQMVFAGEAQRTKGDIEPAQKVITAEAARKKAEADRQAQLVGLEGVDYERRAGIYKDVVGQQRKKAEVEAERQFKASESAKDIAARAEEGKKDRASRETIARIPAKEIQLAQQLMAKDPSLSYLDAVDKAAKALSPKDTYNSTRNALTKAADAVGAEMKNLELMNPEVRKLREKALKGDKTAQAQYQEIRNGVEQRVFKEYQVEGVNLSQGAVELKGAPTRGAAPKPATPAGVPVTTPDGQTFYFPDQKAADDFKSRAGIK